MAFQHSQRPRPPRHLSSHESVAPAAVSPQRTNSLIDPDEWVLFSPSTGDTTSSGRTPLPFVIPQWSDCGSLNTAPRSDSCDENDDELDLTSRGTGDDSGVTEPLESLGDGLNAFHEPSPSAEQPAASSLPVFPTHDGLGTFSVTSTAMQQQLQRHEKRGIDRGRPGVARRRSSVQRKLDALKEADALEHDDRTGRIEQWRLNQNRALQEETERETRRLKRMSRMSSARSSVASLAREGRPAEDGAGESLWQLFTRRVIRDIFGIDDDRLFAICGESVPNAPTAGDTDFPSHPDSWESRLMQHISRELGILVHHFSEHPGAFSTYRLARENLDHAGIPPHMANAAARRPSISVSAIGATPTSAQSRSVPSICFAPTMPPRPSHSESALWGIEEEAEPDATAADACAESHQREREYWERNLDVKMVFNFIRDRFSSRPTSPADGTFAATNPTDNAAAVRDDENDNDADCREDRAALIRLHHPLATRPAEPASAVNLQRTRLSNRNAGSSCASQSTLGSSSRNYWDLGGSVVNGPAGGPGAATWGEI